MRDLSGGIYRHFPAARLIGAAGEEHGCRGLVVQLGGESLQAHETGQLPSPRLAFTGSMEELARPGDILEQGGRRYRVLECDYMYLGGTAVCARALLERAEDAEDTEDTGETEEAKEAEDEGA